MYYDVLERLSEAYMKTFGIVLQASFSCVVVDITVLNAIFHWKFSTLLFYLYVNICTSYFKNKCFYDKKKSNIDNCFSL